MGKQDAFLRKRERGRGSERGETDSSNNVLWARYFITHSPVLGGKTFTLWCAAAVNFAGARIQAPTLGHECACPATRNGPLCRTFCPRSGGSSASLPAASSPSATIAQLPSAGSFWTASSTAATALRPDSSSKGAPPPPAAAAALPPRLPALPPAAAAAPAPCFPPLPADGLSAPGAPLAAAGGVATFDAAIDAGIARAFFTGSAPSASRPRLPCPTDGGVLPLPPPAPAAAPTAAGTRLSSSLSLSTSITSSSFVPPAAADLSC
eukprot:365682-Chlamydomonas_euryale.AAC.15